MVPPGTGVILLLVIRSVTDILWAQRRFVKLFFWGGGSGPTHFLNLLWVRSKSVTDLMTNIYHANNFYLANNMESMDSNYRFLMLGIPWTHFKYAVT